MPAYNAESTLRRTVTELPDAVDIKILVDDCSNDDTAELAASMGIRTFVHNRNYGYGRNQQTCYAEALAAGADIVVMVHPGRWPGSPDRRRSPLSLAGHIGGRGAGKTRLGAIATLLDLLHKPGINIRILAGSLEQSLRMWEHLTADAQLLTERQDLDFDIAGPQRILNLHRT